MNTISLWIQYLTQWQNIAMMLTAVYLWIEISNKPLAQRLWNGIRFKKAYVILAVIGLSALIFREWANFNPAESFSIVAYYYPSLTFWEQLAVWNSTTHLRSIIFFSAMILWLWRKYDKLLPALATGWFSLAVVELSFIPDMLLDPYTHDFLGWAWYLPFIGTMPLFLFHWKEFSFKNRKLWLFLGLAIFVQYFLLIWRPWGLTIWDPSAHTFVINQAMLPHPPLATWWFEFLNHLMKSLFSIAFCFVARKEASR